LAVAEYYIDIWDGKFWNKTTAKPDTLGRCMVHVKGDGFLKKSFGIVIA
jgi:hypothetical protein